ncbi:MAG: hypothetical protein U0183_01225 [Polyangiaceae bacterium]
MSEDAIRESLRAMLREMTIKHAADMVGVSHVTATRVLAGLPVKAPSRAKLAAFFAANPGTPARTWASTSPVAG